MIVYIRFSKYLHTIFLHTNSYIRIFKNATHDFRYIRFFYIRFPYIRFLTHNFSKFLHTTFTTHDFLHTIFFTYDFSNFQLLITYNFFVCKYDLLDTYEFLCLLHTIFVIFIYEFNRVYIRKNRVYIRPKSYVDFKIVCRDFVQCDVSMYSLYCKFLFFLI